MTNAEQSIADDKARAEIANLNALTAKLAAETAKINTENRWYLLVVGAAAMAAALAIAKLLL